MTEQEEAKQLWVEAKKDTDGAREAVGSAEQILSEAKAHLNKCHDQERSAWVAAKDAEWRIIRNSKGEVLKMKRVPTKTTNSVDNHQRKGKYIE